MAITYTNDMKTNISDPLRSLMYTEFAPVDVVFDNMLDPARMTRGEYIRYYFLDSNEVAKFSSGETREYTLEIVYYFDTRLYREKKAFDNLYSDRVEHLKRLLYNNFSYNDGTYRWHNLAVELEPIQTVEELEDIESEETMAQSFIVTITRNNYRT